MRLKLFSSRIKIFLLSHGMQLHVLNLTISIVSVIILIAATFTGIAHNMNSLPLVIAVCATIALIFIYCAIPSGQEIYPQWKYAAIDAVCLSAHLFIYIFLYSAMFL
ncbi:MAG: hypothetical protein ABIO57_01275 [Candidatus Paceibacterota bacterium]